MKKSTFALIVLATLGISQLIAWPLSEVEPGSDAPALVWSILATMYGALGVAHVYIRTTDRAAQMGGEDPGAVMNLFTLAAIYREVLRLVTYAAFLFAGVVSIVHAPWAGRVILAALFAGLNSLGVTAAFDLWLRARVRRAQSDRGEPLVR